MEGISGQYRAFVWTTYPVHLIKKQKISCPKSERSGSMRVTTNTNTHRPLELDHRIRVPRIIQELSLGENHCRVFVSTLAPLTMEGATNENLITTSRQTRPEIFTRHSPDPTTGTTRHTPVGTAGALPPRISMDGFEDVPEEIEQPADKRDLYANLGGTLRRM